MLTPDDYDGLEDFLRARDYGFALIRARMATGGPGWKMSETFLDGRVTLHCGDVRAMLATIPENSIDCVVTSPPYWGLRDYGVAGQIGLEPTLGEHLAVMVDVFAAVHRVLKPTGTLFLNYGDCYATSPNGRSAADTKAVGNDDRTFRDKPFSTIGPIYSHKHDIWPSGRRGGGQVPASGYLKSKDLCMVPNRLAIALQDWGWWVRSEIIWGKRNGMPDSSGKYRPSTAHEKIFMLTKTANSFYDAYAVSLPCSTSTHARVSQDVANQVGSARANGGAKTNGNMKAVIRKNPDGGWKGKSGVSPKSAAEVLETRYLRNYESAPLEVWPMATHAFAEAHFATFPPELAERAIKAGTSEKGCCAKCGAPWLPIVERHRTRDGETLTGSFHGSATDGTQQKIGATGVGHWRDKTETLMLGWEPSCACDAHVVPAIVLDPFGGSGTTAMVALLLGRTATLIELNQEYCTMARARIEAAFMGKDEGARHMAKSLGRVLSPGPLFDGAAQ